MEQVEINESNTIYFYFDTVESKLSVPSFNQLVSSLNVVTSNVSKAFLGEQSKCSIYILPSEEGSFKSKFCIFITGAIATTVLGNLGDGILEGFTGHDSKYYGKKTAELVRDVTIGIFSTTKDELNNILPDEINLDEAIEAKSKFYMTIINDNNVKSLGFSDTDKYKIKKSEMGYYISPDRIREVDNDIQYSKLKIIKPVLIKSHQAWTLRDENKTKNDEYKVLDDDFTEKVWDGKNPLKVTAETDTILARVEFVKEMRNGKVITKETNITDVYQFNGKQLKELPDDFELNIVKVPKQNNNQLNLFDQLKQNKENEDE